MNWPQQGFPPQYGQPQQPSYGQQQQPAYGQQQGIGAPFPQQQQNYGQPQQAKFIEFITPVGVVEYCYIDQPQIETVSEHDKSPKLDKDGLPVAYKKITMSWPKAEMETTLIPFRTLAGMAKDIKWPPGTYDPSMFYLEPFLRDGDNPQHNNKNKPELRGRVYMTFKMKCKVQRVPVSPNNPQGIIFTGAPGIMGPYQEELLVSDIYSGCNARVSGIMFGTEYSGKKFISVRLNNIQKHSDGERRAGGAPSAQQQFSKAPPMEGLPPPGMGALPGAMPGMGPFGTPPGAFMPTPQQQAWQQQQQAPFGHIGGNAMTPNAFSQNAFGGQQGFPPQRTIL